HSPKSGSGRSCAVEARGAGAPDAHGRGDPRTSELPLSRRRAAPWRADEELSTARPLASDRQRCVLSPLSASTPPQGLRDGEAHGAGHGDGDRVSEQKTTSTAAAEGGPSTATVKVERGEGIPMHVASTGPAPMTPNSRRQRVPDGRERDDLSHSRSSVMTSRPPRRI